MEKVIKKIKACNKCEISKDTKRKSIGRGSKNPRVLFVGLNPGKEENETGRPFSGPSGKLLDKWIDYLEIRKDDYAIVNLIKCYTPNQSGLSGDEAKNCMPFLAEQMTLLDPEYIITLGALPAKKLIGNIGGITTVAGKLFDDKYIALPHPSYYLRQGGKIPDFLDKVKEIISLPTDRAPEATKAIECNVPEEDIEEFIEELKKAQKNGIMVTDADAESIDFIVTTTNMESKVEPQSYVPIHVHTIYSDTDSVLRIDKLTDYAKEKGFTALAITDHGTISGWWEFQNQCESKGIKPVLGIEFYMAPSLDDKTTKRYHVVAYAKNQEGLKNIFELVEFSMRQGFYRKPRITLEELYEHREGLVITTACGLGLVALRISEGHTVEAENLLVDLKDKFGDDLYIELQPHDFHEQRNINPILTEWGKKHDIKTVITTDAHYLLGVNQEDHKMLKAICYNQPLESAGFSIDTNFIMLEDELVDAGLNIDIPEDVIRESMKNTLEIPAKCEGRLIPYENALPKFEIPEEEE